MTPRRRALYASAASALVTALLVTSLTAITPVSAEATTGNAELDRAYIQLADCEAMRAGATTSRQRAWGNDCIAMARAWIERLSASPSPSPSAPSPTASPSPSPTTPQPSPSTTTTPTTPPPSPSPTPPPAGCDGLRFPTADCTGVPAGWTPLRIVTGDLTITTPGTVIADTQVRGSVRVQAHNVRIVDSEIWGQVKNQYSGHIYDGLVVQRSTIGPPTGTAQFTGGLIEGTGYTAIGNHLRNNTEGFRNGGYSYGGDQAGPVVLVGNYVRLRGVSGLCAHTDGLQGYDESPGAIVRNNTIDLRGISCTTAAVYIGFPFGALEVADNLLMGGDSYVMRLEGTGSRFGVVSGNRLVGGQYGPVRVASCSTVGVWRDNRTATIAADGTVVDGALLTNCPEDTGSLGHVFL